MCARKAWSLGSVRRQSDSHTVIAKSEYSKLATGAKVNRFMSAKIKYTDEPIGPMKVVPDFLPAPEDLVFKEDTVKVTIALS
jgi:hypothetical protein